MRPVVSLRVLTNSMQSGINPDCLRLYRSLHWPIGQVEIELSSGSGFSMGDSVVIAGGMDGEATNPLFAGQVCQRRSRATGEELLIEEATGSLARLYVDKTVETNNAGQIITDYCREAQVESRVGQPGVGLSSLSLPKNRNAMEHILRLAQDSKMIVRTNTNGMLIIDSPVLNPKAVVSRRLDPVVDWETVDALEGQIASSQLSIANFPPVDLGEGILLKDFGAGDGLARVITIEILWSAQRGLLTKLSLQGLGV